MRAANQRGASVYRRPRGCRSSAESELQLSSRLLVGLPDRSQIEQADRPRVLSVAFRSGLKRATHVGRRDAFAIYWPSTWWQGREHVLELTFEAAYEKASVGELLQMRDATLEIP